MTCLPQAANGCFLVRIPMSPTAAMAECCRSGRNAQHAHDESLLGASNIDAIATLIFSSALTLGVELDSRQTLEVRILRPKRRAMSLRGCEHYAVRHRYPVQD